MREELYFHYSELGMVFMQEKIHFSGLCQLVDIVYYEETLKIYMSVADATSPAQG